MIKYCISFTFCCVSLWLSTHKFYPFHSLLLDIVQNTLTIHANNIRSVCNFSYFVAWYWLTSSISFSVMIAPVSVDQHWRVWTNQQHGSTKNWRYNHDKAKHKVKWSPPPFRRRYFQMHFREWKFCILIKVSLKFVPNGLIDNNPALVKILTWHRIGDKPLS